MTEREQFEAWMRSRDETYLFRRDSPGSTRIGQYCRQAIQDQWEAWQASRRAALEESALAVRAEQLGDPTDSPDDIAYELAVRDCEAAARALSGPTET